jgi:hypothetical protein
MSQVLIQQYLNQLQDLRKVSGTHRESVVREAFKDLLKGWARSHDLVFVPEYEIETKTKDRRYVDGALLYELRMPFGYWEAKDEKDDLDAEIEYKFRRGYESVAPAKLKRIDIPDEKASKAGLSPKAMLKADKETGRIVLDSETTLSGVPAEAWQYKLGNRSALERILDQYKEKKPKDPTIREKFDTYRFADYKEKVIDLLMRVTTVSVQTQKIVAAMKDSAR